MEPPKIPESVMKEISLYMSAGEKIVDAIASASGPVGKLGELWMILSDQTVIFHTKEYGKNPVVALISRKDLKVVKYDQHVSGTTLIFVPASHPKNIIKVPFPKIQRPQVNRFCEELAKTIPFELVGQKEQASLEAPPAAPDNRTVPVTGKQTATAPAPKPASSVIDGQGRSFPAAPGSGVKIVKTPAPKPPAPEKPASIISSPSQAAETAEMIFDPPSVKFVLTATALSVLVGFLWYRLFKSLFDSK